jgi:PAS domain S-box-containing protein
MAQPYTILLIEDDPTSALLTRRLLTGASQEFALVQVGTLAAGLAILAQGGIDLVLADLGLPDSQGLNTLIEVLHHNPEAPVVVLSSSEDDEHVLKAVQQGAQDYLVKGQFDTKTLVRSLRYALDRHQAEQALKQEQVLAEVIFQTICSLVMVLDHQGRILRFNRAWEEATGYTAADLWDQCFWELLYPLEEQPAMQNLFETLRTQPATGEFEHVWLTRDGKSLTVKWHGAVLFDRRGGTVCVVIVGCRLPPGGDFTLESVLARSPENNPPT